ncbi:MAG: hypothetical protein ACM3X1_00730 [Ignavibacteriales bacterium]
MFGNPSDTGDSINAATLLQFNATIIVGILFFLSLSTDIFGVGSSPEQQQQNNKTITTNDISRSVNIYTDFVERYMNPSNFSSSSVRF